MPYDQPDPSDPMLLLRVAVPAGAEAQREMAYALAEEFARLGYTGKQILALFRKPFYSGAHRAYRQLGQQEICAIVAETVAVWGRARPVDREAAPTEVRSEGET
jgi:hypothetical protein